MDCRATLDLIARGVSGNSSPEDETALRSHVARCPACAEALDRARRVWSLMGALRPVASSRPAPAFRRRSPFRWAGAAAAAALLLATAALLFKPAPPAPHAAKAPAPVEARDAEPESPTPSPEQVRIERSLENLLQETAQPALPETPRETPTLPAPAVVVRPPAPPPAPVVAAPPPPSPADPQPKPAPRPAGIDRSTLPAVATLGRVQGDVFGVLAQVRSPLATGHVLVAGEGIETSGKDAEAVVEYTDGTRLVLGEDTSVSRLELRGGKQVHLAQGVLAAEVARQPAGESMTFSTPTAEAKVLGTRLTLVVTRASTRLEVREGRVRLVRSADGASVEVGPDHFAVAAKGTALVSKAIPGPKLVFRDDFNGTRWLPAWSAAMDASTGLKLSVHGGTLLIATSKSSPGEAPAATLPNDAAGAAKRALDQLVGVRGLEAGKEWPRAAALTTRPSFAVGPEAPLRLRVRVMHTTMSAGRAVRLGFHGSPAQGVYLERQGDVLSVVSEGAAAPLWSKEIAVVEREGETFELWMTRDRIAVRREGATLYAGPNPLKAKSVQVVLASRAKAELPRDEESRVDEVDAAYLSKGELEDLGK